MTNINYDCLRAIAFELNCGYGFKESVNDLNILCTDGAESYCTLELEYANNKKFMRNVSLIYLIKIVILKYGLRIKMLKQ